MGERRRRRGQSLRGGGFEVQVLRVYDIFGVVCIADGVWVSIGKGRRRNTAYKHSSRDTELFRE